MDKNKKPLIGISACLLGEPVRYNKGNTADKWIIRELSKFVDFHPLCPEVAMGLGTPREEINLYYTGSGDIRLRSKYSKRELTETAKSTYKKMNGDLKLRELDGFILMRKSPSCGLGNVKTVSEDEQGPIKRSKGLLAHNLEKEFPVTPKIDSGRLKNIELRENFIKNVYAHFRFKQVATGKMSLQSFHMKYKYTLMDHCQDSLRELGRIVANHEGKNEVAVHEEYRIKFFNTLAIQTSISNRTNTLQHLMGYLKKNINGSEKTEILKSIEQYKESLQSYMVPFNILYFLIKKYNISYLLDQYIFAPYPIELKLHKGL